MSKQTRKARPNQLFVKIGSGKTVLCQIPTHEKTTVRDLKIQLQPKCRIEANNQLLTYHGKMLWDDDLLQVETNATLHLSHKLRGGLDIGDEISKVFENIIKPVTNLIDQIINFVKDIFKWVKEIFENITCVIRRLETLRFCIIFYILYIIYKIIIIIFYLVLTILGIMMFMPWMGNFFLKNEQKLFGFIVRILKKIDGVSKIIYAIECCFKCKCENGSEDWINNLFSMTG